MKLKQALWLSIACVLCLSSGQAQAASITIFNTGVNISGTGLLPDGTIGDPHYKLIAVPGGTFDIRIREASGGYPIPPYIGFTGASNWIGPNNASDLTSPVGDYVYQTTFDLTGFDLTTVSLAGNWMTDNNGLSLSINGNPLAFTTGVTSFSSGFSFFTVNSGFNPGLNYLNFSVRNLSSVVNPTANPTALRVEISGTGTAVPEPATLLLLGSGLVSLAAWRRKHAA